MQFSMPDHWSRHLFLALRRRYGLQPYRRHRQRHNTVIVRVPQGFANEVLWPDFTQLQENLETYLQEVTLRIIREEVHPDASDGGGRDRS
jgi:hypothetical protein